MAHRRKRRLIIALALASKAASETTPPAMSAIKV